MIRGRGFGFIFRIVVNPLRYAAQPYRKALPLVGVPHSRGDLKKRAITYFKATHRDQTRSRDLYGPSMMLRETVNIRHGWRSVDDSACWTGYALILAIVICDHSNDLAI